MVDIRHGHEAPDQADHRVGLGLHRVLILRRHPHSGEDEKGPEDVDDPVELLDQVRPGANHGPAHGERPQDAPEEDPMLVPGRNAEVAEEEGEDEDVVDGKCLLDEIARQELERGGTPQNISETTVKRECHEHPEHAPRRGLRQPDLVGLAMEHEEVEREQRQHEEVKANPEPQLVHCPIHVSPSRLRCRFSRSGALSVSGLARGRPRRRSAGQELVNRNGARYHHGERISTGFVESTVNRVVSERMVKKQQMQWTKRGAHLLLQIRTRVLNDEWEATFRTWYPGIRSPTPCVAA
jgi:hypothetical protein